MGRAFEEAEKARMAYMKEHMRLVAIRARAAKAYFGAKARAAALLIIRNRFDSVLRSWVVKHKASIKADNISRLHMRLAWDARLKAVKHHRISMAALHLARHHESEAKERWEHAQEVMSKAHTKLTAATNAHHTAHLDASIKAHIKAMDNRHRLFKAAEKAHRHVVKHATKNMRHM